MYVNEHPSALQCAKASRKKKSPDIVEKLMIIWHGKECPEPATCFTWIYSFLQHQGLPQSTLRTILISW